MVTRAKRSVIASQAGLKRLEEKRRMSGKSAEVIGQLAGVSRSSAQKFFNGEPISVENFRSLCGVLGLNWEEIVESEEITSSVTTRKRVAFVIEGSLDDLDPTKLAKLQAMVRALQQVTGDASMTVVDVEEGSIRLILEGSEQGIERLKQLFADELAEVLGVPVRAVEPVELDVLNSQEEIVEDRLKALLVSMIQANEDSGADLSGADLSDTDLSGANLSGGDLKNSIARDLTHARDFTRDLAFDLARNSALDLDLARHLSLYLDRALARAIDLDHAHNSALDLDLALSLDIALDCTRDLDRTLNRAHALLSRIRALARALPMPAPLPVVLPAIRRTSATQISVVQISATQISAT